MHVAAFLLQTGRIGFLSEMLSGDMIEASKIMQTLNDMDRLVHRSRYTRIGKRV